MHIDVVELLKKSFFTDHNYYISGKFGDGLVHLSIPEFILRADGGDGMGWMRCTRICPASWPVSSIGFYAHLPYPVDTNLLKWSMFLMKEPRSHGIGEPSLLFWQGKNNLNKQRKQPDLGSSEVCKMGFMSGIVGLVISLRLSDSTMWQIWRVSLERNAIKGGKQMDPLQRNVTKKYEKVKKTPNTFPISYPQHSYWKWCNVGKTMP